ncbi:MAG: DUF6489 family protein [Alphaproteobacteria bacterium]
MKFNIEIDCSPEEARAFFGLPDVAPMQERLMRDMEEKLRGNMLSMDPDAMMKSWMPMATQGAMQGWGEMQKMFWEQMGMGMSSGASGGKGGKSGKSGSGGE